MLALLCTARFAAEDLNEVLSAWASVAVLLGSATPAPPGCGLTVRTDQEKAKREKDFYGWVLDQADTLRVRKPQFIDWAELAEELEEMALRIRHELLSHLEELFAHLLKLQYEPSAHERSRRQRQWKLHLAEHRHRVNDLLDDSRLLRNMFEDLRQKAYQRACRLAAIDLSAGFHGAFPAEPPWTNQQIRDDDFFPEPATINGHARKTR